MGHRLDHVPPGDWDDMVVGDLRYIEVEPLRAWEIALDTGGDGMRLRWDGFTGVVDYADNADTLPRAVAWGHYEQTCRVTGEVRWHGRTITVDGAGQRDHSWGLRDWAGLAEWHWITGFAGEGGTRRAFNLFHVVQPTGEVTVNGYVHDGGADHLIVDAKRVTDETATRSPRTVELALTVEGGRTFAFTGAAAAIEVPVQPGDRGTVVHEVPMRLRTDDGLDGYGVYELLENDSAGG